MSFIVQTLNQHFQHANQLPDEDFVTLSGLYAPDGTNDPGLGDRLAVFLVNVAREDAQGRAPQQRTSFTQGTVTTPAPLALNIYVMIASANPNYAEALKSIGATIQFFQTNPVFTSQNAPALPPVIQKLVLDMENLSLSDLMHLWGMLSSKYVPSVVYKMRLVQSTSAAILGEQPVVDEVPVEVLT